MRSNINYVKDEMRELRAKKKYGQNFLIDENICDKIAKIACDNNLPIIEIGPGLGALSEKLILYSNRVDAYEIDEDMYNILKNNLEADNFNLYLSDFLDVDLSKYNEKINICGNLPYYVTTPILFKIFEADLDINKITVMVQKEVADRINAKVGSEDYGSLSLEIQYLFDVKYEMDVSRNVFYPKPNVDSSVISFISKGTRYDDKLFELIKNCFRMRRKTLHNNLKDIYDEDTISRLYKELDLKENVRAQELDLDIFIKMNEMLG